MNSCVSACVGGRVCARVRVFVFMCGAPSVKYMTWIKGVNVATFSSVSNGNRRPLSYCFNHELLLRRYLPYSPKGWVRWGRGGGKLNGITCKKIWDATSGTQSMSSLWGQWIVCAVELPPPPPSALHLPHTPTSSFYDYANWTWKYHFPGFPFAVYRSPSARWTYPNAFLQLRIILYSLQLQLGVRNGCETAPTCLLNAMSGLATVRFAKKKKKRKRNCLYSVRSVWLAFIVDDIVLRARFPPADNSLSATRQRKYSQQEPGNLIYIWRKCHLWFGTNKIPV